MTPPDTSTDLGDIEIVPISDDPAPRLDQLLATLRAQSLPTIEL